MRRCSTRTILVLPILATLVLACRSAARAQGSHSYHGLPPTLGLTQDEIIRLAIPDYDSKLKEWQTAEDNFFGQPAERKPNQPHVSRASIVETLETDFGWKNHRYLMVVLNGVNGLCMQCVFTVVAVVDLDSKKLAWKTDPPGHEGCDLDALKLTEEDTTLCFSYAYDAGGRFHNHYLQQVWLRPRLMPDGTIACDSVWSGLLESASGVGGYGSMQHERCASMTVVPSKNQFEYRRRSFFGLTTTPAGNPTPDPANVDDKWDKQVPCEDGYFQAVEIRRLERWDVDATTHSLKRTSITAQRIDHYPSRTWPFNLPVRSSLLSAIPARKDSSTSRIHSSDPTLSPKGNYRVERRDYAGKELCLLTVRKKDDQCGRTIEVNDFHTFAGTPRAIGWADDESRFFVVVQFEEEKAMLSFSTSGQDDWWEGLLTADPRTWSDGFVITLPTGRGKHGR